MRLIDAQFPETPSCGSRQTPRHLRRQGHAVNRKRVRRLMLKMGRTAVHSEAKDDGSQSRAQNLTVSAARHDH